jgi:hypothetical protein
MSRVEEPELVPPPAANSDRRSNFLVRFWRGEYSLGVSYWLFGLLGNVALAFIADAIAALFQIEQGYDPRAILGSLVSIWLVTGVFLVWQVTGIWRSASRNGAGRRAIGKRAFWASAAKIALVLGVCSSLVTFYSVGLPQIAETSRMVFLNDPDIAPYSIRVMRNGTEAEIAGGFKYGLTNDFVRTLKAYPNIKVVHLNSLGGRVGEAIRLNGALQAQGVDTYVSAGCYSACTIAFAAGRKRFLKAGAALGFHAATFPGTTASDLDNVRLAQQRLFLAAGFDDAFVDKALSTPSSQMWTPPAAELTAAKVITGISDGNQFAFSGLLGRDVSRNRLDALMMQGIPLLKTIKEHAPGDYDDILTQYLTGYVEGRTEMEVETQGRASILSLVRKLEPMADDAVMAEISLLHADEYAAMGAKDPSLCYQYASGNFANIDLADVIPALIERENQLSQRVLETAKPRPDVPQSELAELWKKIDARLSEKGVSDDQLKLLDSGPGDATRYSEYCSVSEASYREIARLPASEAGMLMRSLLSNK